MQRAYSSEALSGHLVTKCIGSGAGGAGGGSCVRRDLCWREWVRTGQQATYALHLGNFVVKCPGGQRAPEHQVLQHF